jgi:hypothetical protein
MASCIARSPSPIAATAVAGSASHRGVTAFWPGSAEVTSQDPSSSAPWARTRGTVM